ncbi:hypothetical protein ACFL59_13155 [Planctomycetota bacterium]
MTEGTKRVLIVVGILLALYVVCRGRSSSLSGDFGTALASALEEARADNKPVFLYFGGDW